MRERMAYGEPFDAAYDREFDRATGRALDLALEPPLDLMFVMDLAAWALASIGAGIAEMLVFVRRSVLRRARVEQHAAGCVWQRTAVAGLLGLAARLLPPENRSRFVEEQCGNLSDARTRLEWVVYLSDLLTEMPRIAVVQHHEGRGRPG